MDDIIIINGVTYKKVAGFECSKCDLNKVDIAVGFCGGFVSNCGNFHYEATIECESCINYYHKNNSNCKKCYDFDMWEDKNGIASKSIIEDRRKIEW